MVVQKGGWVQGSEAVRCSTSLCLQVTGRYVLAQRPVSSLEDGTQAFCFPSPRADSEHFSSYRAS